MLRSALVTLLLSGGLLWASPGLLSHRCLTCFTSRLGLQVGITDRGDIGCASSVRRAGIVRPCGTYTRLQSIAPLAGGRAGSTSCLSDVIFLLLPYHSVSVRCPKFDGLTLEECPLSVSFLSAPYFAPTALFFSRRTLTREHVCGCR